MGTAGRRAQRAAAASTCRRSASPPGTRRWRSTAGRPGRTSLPDLDWYFAYNLFRLVGILQGVAARAKAGNAASEHASAMAARVPKLAAAAWGFAERAGA